MYGTSGDYGHPYGVPAQPDPRTRDQIQQDPALRHQAVVQRLREQDRMAAPPPAPVPAVAPAVRYPVPAPA